MTEFVKQKIAFDIESSGQDENGLISYYIYYENNKGDQRQPDTFRWLKTDFEPTDEDIAILALEHVLKILKNHSNYELEEGKDGVMRKVTKNSKLRIQSNG